MNPKDKRDGGSGLEAVPARIVIPAAPLAPAGAGQAEAAGGKSGEAPMQGVVTMPTSIDAALKRSEHLQAECRRFLLKEDGASFLKLLDRNPHLIADAWVREKLVELAAKGRLTRRRGRPAGRYETHPLVVVGWVEQAIRTGAAKNREKALALIEESGWLSYEAAKDLLYRALRDERFHSILLTLPELAREVAQADAAALRGAEKLEPGRPVTRTILDNAGNPVKVTFRSEANKK